ncbi:DotA/TraY family protein, partial [Streptomyces cyaneofuscatus]|uniref:DotA/TraY family protein n=1 Tax=Streptomyces cyaneofuscatus TaxID=66883 RepID=UPI002FEEA1DD
YTPLRMVGGTAALLPMANGFSLVQITVLWIAIQGAGAADSIWGAMMEKLTQDNMIGRPSIPDSRPLAANILRFEVCMAAMNKQFQESGRNDRITVAETQKTITNTGEIFNGGNLAAGAVPVAGAINLVSSIVNARYVVSEYQWSASARTYQNPNVCGALHWTQSEESSESNGSTAVSKGPILAAHSQAVKTMIATLRPAAEQIAAGGKPAPGLIDQAAFAYENALRNGASIALKQSNDSSKTEFIQLAKDGGWLYAGTYYNQIVRLNDAMQSAINALPTSEPVNIDDKEAHETLLTYRDALAVADEYIKNRAHSPQSAYQQEWQSAYKDPDGSVKIPRSWEDIKRLFSLPAMGAIHQMTQEIAGSNLSHISQMKAVGDTIVSAAWGLAGTLAVGSGLASSNAAQLTVGNVFDMGAALASMSGMLGTIFSLLLCAGLILAFYVPMIPYISWIVACIKRLVMVVQNVVAAPVFAAAHVHPDGDDTVGRAGPGYMIILSTLMRPSLMVFGLIFSITLAQPITHLVNATYMTAVAGSMHDSFNGLGAFVAYSVLYAFIMSIVVDAVFALVNYLQDNVLRWMGNAVGANGIGDREEHEIQGAVMGNARNAAHSVVPGGGKPKTPPAAAPASQSPTMQELLPPPV